MFHVRLPIRPAGMITDIVENELEYRHDEVTNLKQNQEGLWENVKGYITVSGAYSGLKNGIEISDDLSGDRFLLFQDGTDLKRLDYNISNSPKTGYEKETPSTLTLPSGVTIGSSAKCRFFYHNGVVRISGPSEPLWYSYIDKTFFPGSWSQADLDDFNSGTDGWLPENGVSLQETTSPILEGAGSLEFTAGAANGYAYKSFSVTANKKYRIFVKGIKESGQTSQNYKVWIGTSKGGSQIAELTHDTDDEWHTFEYEFTPTVSTIWVAFTPIDNGDYIHFDYFLLQENHEIVVQDWYLFKASLDIIGSEIDFDVQRIGSPSGGDSYTCLGGQGTVYDRSQYSLPEDMQVASQTGNAFTELDNELWTGVHNAMRAQLNVKMPSFTLYRITGFLAGLYTQASTGLIDTKQVSYNIHENISIDEDLDAFIFQKANFYADVASYPKRLNITRTGAEEHTKENGYFYVGARIKIRNTAGYVDSIITTVYDNGANNLGHYIEILDDVSPLGDGDISNCGVWIERIWKFTNDVEYETNFGMDILGANSGSYASYTEITAGTKSNTPNYTHHQVIGHRGFCISNESDEQDTIYYTPTYQYDNFLAGNVVQTPVGDIDRNLALIERDDRFVALKRHSISQGQFTATTYYHDKNGKKHGLYATEGFIVIDDILYFMDSDDVYVFNGVVIEPWLENAGMRQIYKQYVEEDSFFGYNPLEKELYLFLNGKTMIYNFERKEWYLRGMTKTPVFAFNDYDKKIIVVLYSSPFYSFVTYNHSYTTFDETITCSFKTGLKDLKTPEYRKICRKVLARVQSNKTLKIKLRDEKESSYYEETKTPSSIMVTMKLYKPAYLFKEAYIEATFAEGTNVAIKLKSLDLIVGRWK